MALLTFIGCFIFPYHWIQSQPYQRQRGEKSLEKFFWFFYLSFYTILLDILELWRLQALRIRSLFSNMTFHFIFFLQGIHQEDAVTLNFEACIFLDIKATHCILHSPSFVPKYLSQLLFFFLQSASFLPFNDWKCIIPLSNLVYSAQILCGSAPWVKSQWTCQFPDLMNLETEFGSNKVNLGRPKANLW